MHRKDQKIRQRSNRYRDEYLADTPSWYRGEMHLGFTLLFTGGVIA
ncbi:MAG: fatty acid hydroxylase, partial [Massilia sp.]|nr:fatty acid hydroxylase [Massilia sp.]